MGKINITPLADRVIIKQAEAEKTTASGIIIPDTAQEKPMEGKVIAVGPGARGDDGKINKLDVHNNREGRNFPLKLISVQFLITPCRWEIFPKNKLA